MNTVYFLNIAAGNIFGTKTTPAIPLEMWIGLSTTAPNANGGNVSEPSSDVGYSRVKLDMLSEPSEGVVTNNKSIEFNESTASWGTVTHFVIFDSENGGNLLQYGALPEPNDVDASTILYLKSGSLELSVRSRF